VRGEVPERLPAAVAQTAYFLVSEALTNAGKHAQCHNVGIRITEVRSTVMVEVADDGRGGASMSGSGLRGLADRIAAVGGRLRVFSPPGQGTRLVAELPCA
jgi:signal transduction histidine kinase